jgi:hypothetical protein
MDFEAEINRKVTELTAAGFDPGPAISGVTVAGAGAYRLHQRAVIAAHPTAGVHEVHGLIMDRYFNRMGGPTSFLGYPTSDEQAAGAGRFSRFEFQGAGITWHPVFGVRQVYGLVGEHYWTSLGGLAGSWGYPRTDEYPDGSHGRSSDFEGGTIHWTPANGILEVSAPPPPDRVVPAAGDWTHVPTTERMRYVVGQLVLQYGFPVDGACGVVGNLWAESAVLPSRIEGSQEATPMRARDFNNVVTDFTAQQVMLRQNPAGPKLPGVGLAQWTTASRRAGMFSHVYQGGALVERALFSMDAQIDYLVTELRTHYASVYRKVTDIATSVEDASDEVVYNFEVPGSVLQGGTKLPRTDHRVQEVFRARRAPSQRARSAYLS